MEETEQFNQPLHQAIKNKKPKQSGHYHIKNPFK